MKGAVELDLRKTDVEDAPLQVEEEEDGDDDDLVDSKHKTQTGPHASELKKDVARHAHKAHEEEEDEKDRDDRTDTQKAGKKLSQDIPASQKPDLGNQKQREVLRVDVVDSFPTVHPTLKRP
ncbi:hypothetical protein HDU67_010272 [Dinochytrium kinnereticum]|nr:hypothetical protein HDU67_010272 [Dinochytrium kinnereticum]